MEKHIYQLRIQAIPKFEFQKRGADSSAGPKLSRWSQDLRLCQVEGVKLWEDSKARVHMTFIRRIGLAMTHICAKKTGAPGKG